jgi:signal transduction histidine kinase
MFDSSFTGKKVEVAFKSNSLIFQFAALNFNDREGMQYEYKLHQNDKQWKSLGHINSISFPDLSPGFYHFQVRARDASGHLSSNVGSFAFRIVPPLWKTWWFLSALVILIGYIFYRWTVYLRRKIKHQEILNYFATSLYGQNTVEDVCWDVAKNCMSQLKFADCVIYLYDPQKNMLTQKAAYGPKNPDQHEIINAIDIPLGHGIVGSVAKSGKPEIVNDTSEDNRYILDDQMRSSEIAVPIFVEGRIFGVIDSEHPKKNFYRKYHLKILQDIAVICSNKISKYIIEERLRAKISRDLHDEIGSALTSINVLSKVAMEKVAPNSGIEDYLAKIKESTFETMESMSDIVWAINPKNDKMEALMSRMKEFAADICEAKQIDLDSELPMQLENLTLDLANRKNLFLIFKEAVNNAVKYSNCTLLSIRFQRLADQLQMEITDNGQGFDPKSVVRGNGLYNMQERVNECNGSMQLYSAEGKGTTVKLQIPITRFGGVTDLQSK